MQHLDRVLHRLDAQEKQAVMDLKRAGVLVKDVTEARKIQAEYRTAVRQRAEAISAIDIIVRKTA
jgi:ribosomal protein S18